MSEQARTRALPPDFAQQLGAGAGTLLGLRGGGAQRRLRTLRWLWIGLLCLALAACETGPGVRPEPSEAERAARALVEQERYTEAAQAYLALAEGARGARADTHRLQAADAHARAGELQAAQELVAATDAGDAPIPALRRDLVLARLALAGAHPERSLALLPERVPENAPITLAVDVHELRARAQTARGEFLAAARERLVLEGRLSDAEAVRANRRALWEELTRLSPEVLDEARRDASGVLAGWIRLADLAQRTITDPSALEQALVAWRRDFPAHPAETLIVPELRQASRERAAPPEHVALLLPFEGRFAGAARAVRDGFIAAWFRDATNASRPTLSVHDTAGQDIAAVYRSAVEAGADFVVGPLEKRSVSALMQADAPIEVPTLLLNQADAQAPAASLGASLYEFSLSPEGEARRVAERAWFDGHQRAAVIMPDNAWGDRVADAFSAQWRNLGGMVVERGTYPSDAPDMSEPVARLLNVDESRQRWRELRELLRRDIKHEPRVREDVDFVFLAAFPRQARQLRPQFKFHGAPDLPIYATSHVYAGARDPGADRDIDGVIFGDMPWVLGPESGLRADIERLWPEAAADFPRLYAFGIDAYSLIPHLGQLRARQYAAFEGATGRLSLNDSNRVERQLAWAAFQDGVPRTTLATTAQR